MNDLKNKGTNEKEPRKQRRSQATLLPCLRPQIGTWQIRKHLKMDGDDDNGDDDDDDDEVFLLAQIYHHNYSSQHRTFSSS